MYKVNDVVYLKDPTISSEIRIAKTAVTQVWTGDDEVCYSLRGIPFRVFTDQDLAFDIHTLIGKNAQLATALMRVY